MTRFVVALLNAWLLVGSAFAADSVRPERIVSLAPHLTELVFAAGAGERIVATVEYSDYPQAALAIPRIGDAFRVDFERLLATKPDIVLAWETGTPVQTIERIRTLGLRVETITTLELAHVPLALRQIGKLVGTQSSANQAAERFEKQIAQLRAEHEGRTTVSVFLQINDRPLYTVNGKHVISEVAALCGGKNVFAALTDLAPAIGIEAVIAANPQAIVSTDDTVPDAAERWRRWQAVTAVRTGNVFTLSSDDLTRATPRLVNGARAMCRALDTARRNLKRSADSNA